MDDLVAFLRARLDEDAEDARKAADETGAPGWRGDEGGLYSDDVSRSPGPFLVGGYGYTDPKISAHVARHDPARVLREVEWKRSLVDLCANVMSGREATGFAPGNAWTIMTRMANSYRDHPDWKPYWPGSG